MSWKSLVLLVATLAFDASLIAQDKQNEPFLGIWELNLEKTTNYPQQSQTMINVPAPGGFISTRATIGKENKSSSTGAIPPAPGRPGREQVSRWISAQSTAIYRSDLLCKMFDLLGVCLLLRRMVATISA